MYAISFDLRTALMDHLYLYVLLSHMLAPYIYTLIVCEFFVSWPSVISDY